MVDDAKQTFLTECTELLENMEQALLVLENEPANDEMINAIFRAAHTIKGTGGIFSFDDVESFTHVVESVLDKIRAGKISIDGDIIALLLTARDHMGALVEAAVHDTPLKANEIQTGETLLAALKEYLGADGAVTAKPKAVPAQNTPQVAALAHPVEWHIALKFGPEVLQSGMDPVSFLRYLEKLGEITDIKMNIDKFPDAEELDPERCYMNFTVTLKSATAKRPDILKVFEFVKEDCDIQILPPVERVWDYVSAIEELPDEIYALGDILKHSGLLTQDELLRALEEQNAMRSASADSEPPKLGEILVNKGMVPSDAVDAALEKQTKGKKAITSGVKQLRIDAEKLDTLINLVGELVISGATTNVLAQQINNGALTESVSSMSRLVEEIRDSALRLRMVHIGETFNRFQRVVRDVSREIGKDIQLLIHGGETELDKTMVEKIGDPLMHLVRNAIDHGIEPADQRLSAGKSGTGTVKLNAYHDSGSIVIQVTDDGRGLNTKKILEKAIAKGIVKQGQSLSEQEVCRLIFEPGFSTAEKVTNLSGRGVGMDVVKKNIEALRGTVDVLNNPGNGTTINIRLPLTLAIIDGFLVSVAGASYVIPLDTVVECIELNDQNDGLSVHNTYINLRGKVLPFLRLSDFFGESKHESARESIVVVQTGGQVAGLVVDELLGEFQTVIKPLGKIFKNIKGISGSTILGSGDVAVILDVPGLVQRAIEQSVDVMSLPGGNELGHRTSTLH